MSDWIKQYKEDLAKEIKRAAQVMAHRFVEDDSSGRFGRPLGLRHDAGETGFLALELEELMAEVFQVDFGPSLAMQILPVDDRVTSADVISYRQTTPVGEATELADYGQDIRTAEVYAEKFTHNVVPYALSYLMDVNTIRQSQLTGVPLEMQKSDAAQLGINQALDTLAATGSTKNNVAGFVNNSSVNLVSAITGTWSAATGTQITNDVLALINGVYSQSLQTREANTLLCGTAQWGYLNRKQADIEDTVANWLIRNTSITRIQPWHKLDLADAAGTGPRLVAFEASPSVLFMRLTQPLEIFAPQLENLVYKTILHARSAGTIIPKPYGITYMDGC